MNLGNVMELLKQIKLMFEAGLLECLQSCQAGRFKADSKSEREDILAELES